MKYNNQNICIFAYGSLISDAGQDITPHIIYNLEQVSPFKLEYVRKSSSRGDAPTLTIYDNGDNVKGKLLVLNMQNTSENVEITIKWLMDREGTRNKAYIKLISLNGFETVLYCEFPKNIQNLTPDYLADLAIKSVEKCPDKNGIKYLYENISNKIITPLTKEYKGAILKKTGCNTLEEAEKMLLTKRI